MELSPSWEAAISLSYSKISEHCMELQGSLQCSQEISAVPILSQINPVHSHPMSLRSILICMYKGWAIKLALALRPLMIYTILILSSHLCLGLPSGLFPSGFSTKTVYAFLFSQCPAHPIPDFIILIIFGKEYNF
jgi:hypothetical protein